jgi:hypothetical protein
MSLHDRRLGHGQRQRWVRKIRTAPKYSCTHTLFPPHLGCNSAGEYLLLGKTEVAAVLQFWLFFLDSLLVVS